MDRHLPALDLVRCDLPEMDVRDGIAWVAEEVTGAWSRHTESGATHFRITTVWEEKDREWKIINAHIDAPFD